MLRQNTLSSQYLPVVNPIFTSLLLTDNSDYSNYNSLQVEYGIACKSAFRCWPPIPGPTPSTTDRVTPCTSSKLRDSNRLPWSFYNVHQDYGNAVADIRNTFSAAATYELPGSGLNQPFSRALLQGWAIDGVIRARSAPPYDVIYSPNVSKFFDLFTPGFNYVRAHFAPGHISTSAIAPRRVAGC